MRALPIALLLALISCSLPALAQEAAPAPAAEASDAEPAPVAAPAWSLQQVAPPEAAYPQPVDPTEARRLSREARRHQRDLRRLESVMAIEGPDFDVEKYDRYRMRMGGGIALVAIGAVSLVTTFIYGFYVILLDIATTAGDSCDPDYEDCSASSNHDDGRLGEPRQRVALWSMFATGIAGIGIGVPLLVSGVGGKRRQSLLQRKDEILAPFDPTASLSLAADPATGAAGLRLRVTF